MSATGEKPNASEGPGTEQLDAYYSEVRGYVRQQLVRRNLKPYLPRTPGMILDFGGGSAGDTIWLAERGHRVAYLDDDPEKVKIAKQKVSEMPETVQEHIKLFTGSTELLRGNAHFDVVLSHAVLMYDFDHPRRQLGRMAMELKPNGYLSLLTKGLRGALHQARHGGSKANYDRLMNNGTYVNNLGLRAKAYTSAELEEMLVNAGLQVVKWSGVRTLPETEQDHRQVDSLEESELQDILARESKAGQLSMKGSAQMLHFIARKP